MAVTGFSQSIDSYVITSTGASLMGSEGALYISIGEPMSTEISEGEIMISQGFLNVSVEGLPLSTDDILAEVIHAYPNPTSADLVIDMPEMDGDYTYQITNALGETIQTARIQGIQTTVHFQDMDAGVYYMRVVKNDKQSRTLKIIKL